MKNFSYICLFVVFNSFSMNAYDPCERSIYANIRNTREYQDFFKRSQELVRVYRSKYFSSILSNCLQNCHFFSIDFDLDLFMTEASYIRKVYVSKFRENLEKRSTAAAENSIFCGKDAGELIALFETLCFNTKVKLRKIFKEEASNVNEMLEELGFLLGGYFDYPDILLEKANSHAELYEEDFMLMLSKDIIERGEGESLNEYNSRVRWHFLEVLSLIEESSDQDTDFLLECKKICTLQLQVLLEYQNLSSFFPECISKEDVTDFYTRLDDEEKAYSRKEIWCFMACEEWAIRYIEGLTPSFSLTLHRCYPSQCLKQYIERI